MSTFLNNFLPIGAIALATIGYVLVTYKHKITEKEWLPTDYY